MAGSGSTTIDSSGRLDVVGAGPKSLSEQHIANFGGITWRDGGGIRAGSGAAIVNNHSFLMQTDAPFDWDGVAPRPSLTNVGGGTLSKSAAPAALVLRDGRLVTVRAGTGTPAFNNVPFSNLAGQVSMQSGALKLNGGGESYGTFNTVAATRVTFTKDYLFDRQLSTFNGAGAARVEGGSFTISDPRQNVNVVVQNFELASGAVAGADNLNIGAITTARAVTPGVFTWTGGAMSGTGQTNIAATALVNISGAGRKDLTGRIVNNSGIVNWDAAAPVRTGSGAVINNRGTFNARNGATLAYNGAGRMLVFNNAGALNPGDAPVPAAALLRENDPRLLNSAPGIGTLTLGGAFTQSLTGALNIQIGGALQSQCDQLKVQSTATLGGTLNVSLANNFHPALGATYQVLSYTAHSGNFKAVRPPALSPGLAWRTDVRANGVFLVVVRASTRAAGDVSSVKLSTVKTGADSVRLWFNGALDGESAADAAHYQVQVNGEPVTVESASYDVLQRCVVLALSQGAVRAGDQAVVTWSDLVDREDRVLSGQVGPVTVR